MTPTEMQEYKQQVAEEFQALKTLFGGLLLESNGNAKPEDIAYFQRKFKEAQQNLRK
jgi:hypothetical protein